ncbi:hypothetical protein K7X08_021082 [Anisodus acutangulus]|uniref:Uncharacterized protein n=1 Tax=Anisodus acutangulus TaxID=402998 RepID=A0A9Q1LZ56_9SOLA|nr:hypothetical protein K7X08_021082 [Anisodus acutangulus]
MESLQSFRECGNYQLVIWLPNPTWWDILGSPSPSAEISKLLTFKRYELKKGHFFNCKRVSRKQLLRTLYPPRPHVVGFHWLADVNWLASNYCSWKFGIQK